MPRLGPADIQWDREMWIDRWEIRKCFPGEKTDSENRREVCLKAHKARVCAAEWKSWRSTSVGNQLTEPLTSLISYTFIQVVWCFKKREKCTFENSNRRTWTLKPTGTLLFNVSWLFYVRMSTHYSEHNNSNTKQISPQLPPIENTIWLHFGAQCCIALHLNGENLIRKVGDIIDFCYCQQNLWKDQNQQCIWS